MSRSAVCKMTAKEQNSSQVKRILDRVWERFVSVSECDDRLGLQDLYCAILLVYNDINKTTPGPWNDPPGREEVEEMLKIFDRNHDGMLDRDDFTAFLQSFTNIPNVVFSSLVTAAIVMLGTHIRGRAIR